MTDIVLTECKNHIYEIILNRPEKRNAMNVEMMLALEEAIDAAEKLDDVRVILVRGHGPTFSAGIDLKGFEETADYFGANWRENLFPMTQRYQGILNKFERSSYPVIALLHNHCIGMAFELALACDFRIATEDARMGLPETRLGLIPDVGGTTRLVRLVGQARAKELIMTGRQFDAVYAERWGIINQMVTEDTLLERGHQLAHELIQAAPLAVSYAKKVIDGIADIDRGLQLEAWAQSILMRTDDFEQGVQSMILKQPAQWNGK